MESNKFDSQLPDYFVFGWLRLSSAVCRLGNGRSPENYLGLEYTGTNFHESVSGV